MPSLISQAFDHPERFPVAHYFNEHCELLLEKASRGKLGAKSGRGFYNWNTSFTEKWRTRMFQNLVELRCRDFGYRADDGSEG